MDKELKTIYDCVVKEYDSRNLKSRVRYSQLEKVVGYISQNYHPNISCFMLEKNVFKQKYEAYKGGALNGAENSSINELYNQYDNLKKQIIN